MCNTTEIKHCSFSKETVNESMQILTSCSNFLKIQTLISLQLFAVIFRVTTGFILHSLSEPQWDSSSSHGLLLTL